MTIANISGGRDSSCMVVKFLELGNTIDYIIFCDTGFEFQEMYEYIDKLDNYLKKEFNKSITRLDSSKEIEKWAFEKEITRGQHKGLLRGIPKTIGKEYCTRETKVYPTKRFVLSKSPNKFKNIALIGYTYNEVEKGRISNLDYAISKYPLHEWRYNEIEVDNFLKKRGIHNPLYNHFTRTGCFFCPKQSKRSLYQLYRFYPQYFQIMKDWEVKAKGLNCVNQTWIPYKSLSLQQKEFEYLDSIDTEPLFKDTYISEHESCFCGR